MVITNDAWLNLSVSPLSVVGHSTISCVLKLIHIPLACETSVLAENKKKNTVVDIVWLDLAHQTYLFYDVESLLNTLFISLKVTNDFFSFRPT